MNRKASIYIRDIIQNMQDAEEFIQGISYEEFESDKKTFNAVVRALEVIGEAAKNVPDSLRSRYPAVPWKEMAGMRDKLVHDYFGVNLTLVWLAATGDLPELESHIRRILTKVSD